MQVDESMLANGFAFKCGHFPHEVLAPKTAEGPTITPEPGRSGVPCSSNSYKGCCTEKASLRLARRTCACFVCAAGAATGTPLTHVMLALAVISTRCHAEVKRAKNAFTMLPANWRSNYSNYCAQRSCLLRSAASSLPSPLAQRHGGRHQERRDPGGGGPQVFDFRTKTCDRSTCERESSTRCLHSAQSLVHFLLQSKDMPSEVLSTRHQYFLTHC